ncbi:hypothetical protein DVR12_19560 [Chitinophaga silvatica]|uniref:OmpA-like domain-containing protein n=1 Tax=Chitinophaga silvatica TaxID=2282649 RepID=A0A3E1Y791_9BACT|nr:OmpA family protein [Chitinophaga silvatica]RFS20771.1 hypothetical protein DVR12_19560 [Chitinophaga silvatica]
MKKIALWTGIACVFIIASCSAPKELRRSQAENARCDSALSAKSAAYDRLKLNSENNEKLAAAQIESLNNQLKQQQGTNDQMLNQLKNLSVISNTQAESIQKSLAYIRELNGSIARKDSLNMALVMNLKGAIGNLDDKDINIKIDKGVVYIDISDKLLFNTGRYEVTERAREILGKVAKVLKNQPSIQFMVEGHTDPVPFSRGLLVDNWDLSVKRATSVVRILQNDYGIPPARMTAAGRGQYVPIASNDTDEGRARNRRTRIVIQPELDQFFELLERPH